MKSPEEVAHEILSEDRNYNQARKLEAKSRMEYHDKRVTHHENEMEADTANHSKVAHHKIAADHHQAAYDHFAKAYNHYHFNNKESGDHHMIAGENRAEEAHKHEMSGIHEDRAARMKEIEASLPKFSDEHMDGIRAKARESRLERIKTRRNDNKRARSYGFKNYKEWQPDD